MTYHHGPGRAAATRSSRARSPPAVRATGRLRSIRPRSLIRRCIHPADDMAAAESLTSNGAGTTPCSSRRSARTCRRRPSAARSTRCRATRARACCTMRAGCQPTSARIPIGPRSLEFPTETWAAQDLRKADVFWLAAGHASDDDERRRFTERAIFSSMTRSAWSTNRRWTATLARPRPRTGQRLAGDLVQARVGGGPLWPVTDLPVVDVPSPFTPQKGRAALRRLIWEPPQRALPVGALTGAPDR